MEIEKIKKSKNFVQAKNGYGFCLCKAEISLGKINLF